MFYKVDGKNISLKFGECFTLISGRHGIRTVKIAVVVYMYLYVFFENSLSSEENLNRLRTGHVSAQVPVFLLVHRGNVSNTQNRVLQGSLCLRIYCWECHLVGVKDTGVHPLQKKNCHQSHSWSPSIKNQSVWPPYLLLEILTIVWLAVP